MTELIWDGKYKDGRKAAPVRIALPFQTIETVNESAQERQRKPRTGFRRDTFRPDPGWRPTLIFPDGQIKTAGAIVFGTLSSQWR